MSSRAVPSACIYGIVCNQGFLNTGSLVMRQPCLQRINFLKMVVNTSDKNPFSYFYVMNLFIKLTRPIYFSLTAYISRYDSIIRSFAQLLNAMHLLVIHNKSIKFHVYILTLIMSQYNQNTLANVSVHQDYDD